MNECHHGRPPFSHWREEGEGTEQRHTLRGPPALADAPHRPTAHSEHFTTAQTPGEPAGVRRVGLHHRSPERQRIYANRSCPPNSQHLGWLLPLCLRPGHTGVRMEPSPGTKSAKTIQCPRGNALLDIPSRDKWPPPLLLLPPNKGKSQKWRRLFKHTAVLRACEFGCVVFLFLFFQ